MYISSTISQGTDSYRGATISMCANYASTFSCQALGKVNCRLAPPRQSGRHQLRAEPLASVSRKFSFSRHVIVNRGSRSRTENGREISITSIHAPANIYTQIYRDYFVVGERVRFLFTSCGESQTNERVFERVSL